MKAVNSLIFVGGFGSTPESMVTAAVSLGNYFEDVSIVSLREATSDFRFARRVDGHPVLTHSAGMMALEGSQPDYVYAVAPPSPTKASRLVTSSLVKSYHLLNRNREDEDRWPVSVYMRETAKEIALHPVVSTRLLGEISVFSAVDKATELERRGVKTEIHEMTRDDFFRPIAHSVHAISRGFGPSLVGSLEGEHDELLVRPHNVVGEIFS